MAGAMSIFIDYTQTKVIREHLDMELEIASIVMQTQVLRSIRSQ